MLIICRSALPRVVFVSCVGHGWMSFSSRNLAFIDTKSVKYYLYSILLMQLCFKMRTRHYFVLTLQSNHTIKNTTGNNWTICYANTIHSLVYKMIMFRNRYSYFFIKEIEASFIFCYSLKARNYVLIYICFYHRTSFQCKSASQSKVYYGFAAHMKIQS